MLKDVLSTAGIIIFALYINFATVLLGGYEKMNGVNFILSVSAILAIAYLMKEHSRLSERFITKIIFFAGTFTCGLSMLQEFFKLPFNIALVSGLLRGIFIVPFAGVAMVIRYGMLSVYICIMIIYMVMYLYSRRCSAAKKLSSVESAGE